MSRYDREGEPAPAEFSTIIGISEGHPLARAIAEATGINTVVVEGRSTSADDPYAGARHAARVALAYFGPKQAAQDAGETIAHIDEVLGEYTGDGEK
jgi:hypothetical protein